MRLCVTGIRFVLSSGSIDMALEHNSRIVIGTVLRQTVALWGVLDYDTVYIYIHRVSQICHLVSQIVKIPKTMIVIYF